MSNEFKLTNLRLYPGEVSFLKLLLKRKREEVKNYETKKIIDLLLKKLGDE